MISIWVSILKIRPTYVLQFLLTETGIVGSSSLWWVCAQHWYLPSLALTWTIWVNPIWLVPFIFNPLTAWPREGWIVRFSRLIGEIHVVSVFNFYTTMRAYQVRLKSNQRKKCSIITHLSHLILKKYALLNFQEP